MRIPVFLIIYVDGLRGDVVDHGCGRLHLRRRFASLGALVRFHIKLARHAPAIVAFEWEKIPFVFFVVRLLFYLFVRYFPFLVAFMFFVVSCFL